MPIYELTPKNLDELNWKASIYRGKAVIKARNEKLARMKANTAFGIATGPKQPFQPAISFPWTNENLVSCQELKDSLYPPDSPDGLIYPENHCR